MQLSEGPPGLGFSDVTSGLPMTTLASQKKGRPQKHGQLRPLLLTGSLAKWRELACGFLVALQRTEKESPSRLTEPN